MAKNYQIALTNVDFDNSYENCLRFDSRAEQEAYFKVNTLFVNLPLVNLDFGTLLTTQIVVKRSVIPTKLMSYNYLIVKDNSENKDLSYLYYFINNIRYDTDDQVIIDVELDVINTYLIDVDFSNCFIEKAHLNRFVENSDGTISFDGTSNSQLFETEDALNLPKRLTKRTKLKLKATKNGTADEWLNNNVAFWVYIYVDKKYQYNVQDLTYKIQHQTTLDENGTVQVYALPNGSFYTSEYGVIAYPIYKSNKRLFVYRWDANFKWLLKISEDALGWFKSKNNNTSYFYNLKFSLIPPFELSYLNCEVNNNGDLIINTPAGDNNNKYMQLINTHVILAGASDEQLDNLTGEGLITNVWQNIANIETENYVIDTKYRFTKNEIVGANKNIKFNPKLLGENFRELVITTQGETFTYDVQKLNDHIIKFLYTEPLQPEITKYYYRLKAPQGLYVEDTAQNYMGVVGSVDNGQAIANDQFSNYLANNKNFWLQSNIKIAEKTTGGIIGGAVAGFKTGGIVGAITGAVGGSVMGVTDLINRELTVDNMKNAPQMLKNANGNVIFNMFVNDLALYVEEYDALDNEKEIVNDAMFKNGFTVNRLGNIKDYLNIRVYFNYVRARVENITSHLQLSNSVRQKFKNIFANGVRFWNVTEQLFKYDKENYERWLKNEQI